MAAHDYLYNCCVWSIQCVHWNKYGQARRGPLLFELAQPQPRRRQRQRQRRPVTPVAWDRVCLGRAGRAFWLPLLRQLDERPRRVRGTSQVLAPSVQWRACLQPHPGDGARRPSNGVHLPPCWLMSAAGGTVTLTLTLTPMLWPWPWPRHHPVPPRVWFAFQAESGSPAKSSEG